MVCREAHCKCRALGCGDNQKMSLKKLIVQYLQKHGKESGGEADIEMYEPVVKVLKDVLARKNCLNVNEELAIRDMIQTRLRALERKCPCSKEPHERHTEEVLRTLLAKCLECDCGQCVWRSQTCEPDENGIYWFRSTQEALRREMPRRTCRHQESRDVGDCKKWRGDDAEDGLKCPRLLADDPKCDGYSLCADCDSCRMVVQKGKENVWLVCDDCRALDSPFVQFTRAGYPVKMVSVGRKRFVKIKADYLQLNDFRRRLEGSASGKSVFECPSVTALSRKRHRKASK